MNPSTTAIRADQLSKDFWIVQNQAATVSGYFIDQMRFWRRPKRVIFNALRDVSLEVCRGETLGLIGVNGSGKSTLLKIIAGIYRPDRGHISVNGRLVALLELGAGFHPELSGRENIYLNGALYGYSRVDLSRRLEAILDFAEIERFADTPLKHYSSGMQMRLGFAVAMSVEAEIMLLDEVFAVGDAAFQAKCFARLREFQAQGRTLVLVSHSMESIRELCTRAVWLEQGRIAAYGPADGVIQAYAKSAQHDELAQIFLTTAAGTPTAEHLKVAELRGQF
ncbi:MAG: hypothetical protein OHK0023_16980 [Anaerolineae bacterium]